MRLSHQTKQVLTVLLDAPTAEVFGYQLTEAAGLPSGTVYPILKRLEQEGWLEGRWEEQEERNSAQRRRRRYYTLTALGARAARAAIAPDVAGLRMLTPGWSNS